MPSKPKNGIDLARVPLWFEFMTFPSRRVGTQLTWSLVSEFAVASSPRNSCHPGYAFDSAVSDGICMTRSSSRLTGRSYTTDDVVPSCVDGTSRSSSSSRGKYGRMRS
ncbi:unnamed protein product [Ectocarpus sp. 13 AM-2016]